MLLAHSADKKRNIPEQSYADHIHSVVSISGKAAENAAQYAVSNGNMLKNVVRLAAQYHDLGKLDDENQKVLAGLAKSRNLPVQHTDAGTAFLLNKIGSAPAAVLARSHHIGLPDFIEESNRSEECLFRDDSVRKSVDKNIDYLIELHHREILSKLSDNSNNLTINGNAPLFFRIALSCLADGDHTDTAIHYGEYPKEEVTIQLKPAERLYALNKYVATLENSNDSRSSLRAEMYRSCRDSDVEVGITSCDSPVGTGKTTAVMAHLLSQAEKRKLRHIIVVLPYINIITQSVDIYRKSLVLPGENPEDVVAELHYRADFNDVHSRHLTALWKAPIIVTTAVTFFETLASNSPATLRRLHNLPGSAIFIDESHAALPAKLYPLAWHWMKLFASEWNCYWTLASGSLNRFWQIPEFDKEPPNIPEIVSDDLRQRLSKYESTRVTYKYKEEPLDAKELVEWIATLPGPRIVILNTVQSAAVVALEFAKKYGRGAVEHLSTALTPKDRADTLKRIKSRLTNNHYELNGDWTLVATSCVEAGVELSFRTGVREIGSLVSLLQIAGRVNRHGFINDSKVWSIHLGDEGLLKQHPAMKNSAFVLRELFNEKIIITPDLCTEALKREIRMIGTDLDKFKKAEQDMRFPIIEKEFRVINTDTRIAVVDDNISKKIEQYQPVDWHYIQSGSVQIWGYKLDALRIQEFESKPGLYKWTLAYDDFIGYMAGVLFIEEFDKGLSSAWVI
jgi:CRISPR-associated endonuclease/helicase Cas3